jgi:hypothetical protein
MKLRSINACPVERASEASGNPMASCEVHEIPESLLEDLAGCTGYRGPARALEDMEAGIAEGTRTSSFVSTERLKPGL